GEYSIPLGQGIVRRRGEDVTVVAFSKMVHVALQAAEELQAEGISVEVIDPRTLYPLDKDLILESVMKTHRLVVVDEDTPVCGMASEICSLVAEEALDYLDSAPRKVTPPHTPVPFAPTLEDQY